MKIIELKVGDVIPLETGEDDEILVMVEGVCKFKGKPGTIKGKTALEITQLMTNRSNE